MTQKPLEAPTDQTIREPVETIAHIRKLYPDAGDGRCNECGRWRCSGNCQFGGT